MTGSEPQASIAGVPQNPETGSMATTGEGPIAGPAGVSADARAASLAGPPYDTDRTLTLPNLLSLLRLAGAPLVLWLILVPQADGLAVLVLAVGGFTDWLDGYLARAWHQTSRLGQMLDPIADRLYILAVLTGLALREIAPWWLVVIVIGRDVMIASLVPLLKTRGFSSLPGISSARRLHSASCTPSRWYCLARASKAGYSWPGCWDGHSPSGGQLCTGMPEAFMWRRPSNSSAPSRPSKTAGAAVRPAARGQTTPATG